MDPIREDPELRSQKKKKKKVSYSSKERDMHSTLNRDLGPPTPRSERKRAAKFVSSHGSNFNSNKS